MPNVNPPSNDPSFNYPEQDPISTVSYCSVGDVADWLRIDINENTNPNRRMIEKIILRNEDMIDRRTGHSWRDVQYANEVFDVNRIFDFGRGMGVFLKHRMIKPFDRTKGDKIEIWDGIKYTWYAIPPSPSVTLEPSMGIVYFRGFIFTLIRKHRFRMTYRYGGEQEGTSPVPRDIEKACLLMTAIDVLSTDFQYSQLSYGGEGNVRKGEIMQIWQDEIDHIIMNRQEIQTVW